MKCVIQRVRRASVVVGDELGIEVKSGRFRAMMIVSLENDGPVTFVWP